MKFSLIGLIHTLEYLLNASSNVLIYADEQRMIPMMQRH